jgi:hypothetical protein
VYHSARWINQIAGCGWDLHVFGAFESPWHPDFENVTAYSYASGPDRADKMFRSKKLWPLPIATERMKMLASRLPEQLVIARGLARAGDSVGSNPTSYIHWSFSRQVI